MEALAEWVAKRSFSKTIILTDNNTARFCLPVLSQGLKIRFHHITIASGENSKSIDNATYIWNQLLEAEADRNALLINLGGGMIIDLGGFCAATYKRGISFINIPTTLLAMVDAAIGGKTAVNIGHYKNQVGLFAEADKVFINPVYLQTLPERELVAGYAEVLKYGLISDKGLWDKLKATPPQTITEWKEIINTCVSIKKEIVKADPKENGFRKILNFGHTIGHAIESYSLEAGNKPVLHGEAVAIGMIAEAWLSFEKSGLETPELEEITTALQSILTIKWPKKPDYDQLYDYMLKDKKNKDREVRFVLLMNIGDPEFDIYCSYEEICRALDYYFSL
jgi:3-dehydroquinate synthase